jgi:hypothetical protein
MKNRSISGYQGNSEKGISISGNQDKNNTDILIIWFSAN